MAERNDNPELESSKLQDFPTRAVEEYFRSKSLGIYKSSGNVPKWNEVPHSASQELVHHLLLEDEVKKNCSELESQCKEREKHLSDQWEEIRELEKKLTLAFIETEHKINTLTSVEYSESTGESSIDERIATLEQESQMLDSKMKWFSQETQKARKTRDNLETEIANLSPYMNFATDVANSQPALYPDGAISVLQQFERLQSAQEEITICQENILQEMEELRQQAKEFTSEALRKLDLLQSRIQEKRNMVKKEKAATEEKCESQQKIREGMKISSGEVEKMEESVKCLYEQLWKRYHGYSSTLPPAKITEQTQYIKLVLVSLDKLAKDLQSAEPNLDQSIQGEASQKT